jgi:hypothetical protein
MTEKPVCSRCYIEAVIIKWTETKCVYRCPKCYRYLGPVIEEEEADRHEGLEY